MRMIREIEQNILFPFSLQLCSSKNKPLNLSSLYCTKLYLKLTYKCFRVLMWSIEAGFYKKKIEFAAIGDRFR